MVNPIDYHTALVRAIRSAETEEEAKALLDGVVNDAYQRGLGQAPVTIRSEPQTLPWIQPLSPTTFGGSPWYTSSDWTFKPGERTLA